MFIIAEIGSNYKDLGDCLESISMAKACGADAAKFQLFSHKDMFGYGDQTPNLNHSWLPLLKEKADACGIEFMCTAFSPESLLLLDPYVYRHKIASSDLTHPELLETANKTGKPIYLSTGASSFNDIRKALSFFPKNRVTLLYCNSSYPAKQPTLHGIDLLKEEFGGTPGYSCHTTDYCAAVYAHKYHGAKVIEKHFKIADMDTPDAPHSLLPDDFKKMTMAIKESRLEKLFPHPAEIDMIKRHKRRLMAIVPINKGEAFRYQVNYGCYRSKSDDLEGLSGFVYNEVNGMISKKDLNPGDPITPQAIEKIT